MAREIYTGPSKRPKQGWLGPYTEDQVAFDTRPGRFPGGDKDGVRKKKDVNLPLDTASTDMKEKMAKLRAMRKK